MFVKLEEITQKGTQNYREITTLELVRHKINADGNQKWSK